MLDCRRKAKFLRAFGVWRKVRLHVVIKKKEACEEGGGGVLRIFLHFLHYGSEIRMRIGYFLERKGTVFGKVAKGKGKREKGAVGMSVPFRNVRDTGWDI